MRYTLTNLALYLIGLGYFKYYVDVIPRMCLMIKKINIYTYHQMNIHPFSYLI